MHINSGRLSQAPGCSVLGMRGLWPWFSHRACTSSGPRLSRRRNSSMASGSSCRARRISARARRLGWMCLCRYSARRSREAWPRPTKSRNSSRPMGATDTPQSCSRRGRSSSFQTSRVCRATSRRQCSTSRPFSSISRICGLRKKSRKPLPELKPRGIQTRFTKRS